VTRPRFGPNTAQVEAIIEQASRLPEYDPEDDDQWVAARVAAWEAAREAAREASRDAAWEAAREASRVAAWDASREAVWEAWDASREAAWVVAAWAAAATVVRDLITADQYAALTAPWQVWVDTFNLDGGTE